MPKRDLSSTPPTSSKQARRRAVARMRAAFTNQPLSIDVRALGEIHSAIESGDPDQIRAAMAFGGDDVPTQTQIRDGVAIIPVVGPLRDEADWMVRWYGTSCYQVIERDLRAALSNGNVRAVVLFCNSPGGQAVGVKRVADAIHESRGEKPIVAYVQGVCASACYYLAAACDRIEATADAIVGSIGTIYTHAEVSGLAKQLGYGFTVFTNEDSPKKRHGNMYEPLSAAAKETLQGFVDSYGAPFIADVARYRATDSTNVIKHYGQGDAFAGSEAKRRGMVDAIVSDLDEVLESLGATAGAENQQPAKVSRTEDDQETETDPGEPTPDSRTTTFCGGMNVKKIKAQLFALGLIGSLEASDETCQAVLNAFFAARGEAVPADEAAILSGLQAKAQVVAPQPSAAATAPAAQPSGSSAAAPAPNVEAARNRELAEARAATAAESKAALEDLQASAKLINVAAGREAVTAAMVLDAFKAGLDCRAAVGVWNEKLHPTEKPVDASRVNVSGEGADRFAEDAVTAMLYRATAQPGRRRGGAAASTAAATIRQPALNDSAATLASRPIWAIAAESLRLAGRFVDIYGDREMICRDAMEMGQASQRHTFYSAHEGRQFIGASGVPYSRPGDFPNILSNLANKFLDSIELDEWTYPEWTAVWPTGFGDFKPATMVNHGTPDELDEVVDSGTFNDLQKAEEVLSYIFCRRFGNKWGWTPVMMANDDLGAFAEGMLGLDEAWETTQHRLCLALITGNPTLLDGSALFASRSQGNNDRTSGGVPSDSEWGTMEGLYADIKGVGSTTRRVRGSLNTILVPTGTQHQEARRTFAPLNAGGLDPKAAATTANVGLYRGLVSIIPEPELRDDSVATRFYGLRSPTQLRTATIVRGYFNGFGAGGRRERWYDPETKTTYVSIEGRIGVAVKNWRYIIRNKGAA